MKNPYLERIGVMSKNKSILRSGMKIYNKGREKFIMKELYKSIEKSVDLCDAMNLEVNEND